MTSDDSKYNQVRLHVFTGILSLDSSLPRRVWLFPNGSGAIFLEVNTLQLERQAMPAKRS